MRRRLLAEARRKDRVQRPSKKRWPLLYVGVPVQLTGLSIQVCYNGCSGTVVSIDAQTKRYQVKLSSLPATLLSVTDWAMLPPRLQHRQTVNVRPSQLHASPTLLPSSVCGSGDSGGGDEGRQFDSEGRCGNVDAGDVQGGRSGSNDIGGDDSDGDGGVGQHQSGSGQCNEGCSGEGRVGSDGDDGGQCSCGDGGRVNSGSEGRTSCNCCGIVTGGLSDAGGSDTTMPSLETDTDESTNVDVGVDAAEVTHCKIIFPSIASMSSQHSSSSCEDISDGSMYKTAIKQETGCINPAITFRWPLELNPWPSPPPSPSSSTSYVFGMSCISPPPSPPPELNEGGAMDGAKRSRLNGRPDNTGISADESVQQVWCPHRLCRSLCTNGPYPSFLPPALPCLDRLPLMMMLSMRTTPSACLLHHRCVQSETRFRAI
jgi:hypothetical protein